VPVSIDVVVDGGDPSAVNSLFRWLQRDRALRRGSSVSLSAQGPPGEMGALEAVNVIVTQGTALANLALAFAAWRDSRAKPVPISVTVNAQTIILGAEDPDDMEREIRSLLATEAANDEGGAAGADYEDWE
jgi:Effector Associated Constant Component 1